ncbi:hypothetical protein GCM10010124_07310 [Pilimelia terevasa]|uniref:Histidine kinase/HSP90-like ATPase domain-containing protein n=1 Tax=Pilimelia terevasa TaxID=53372 RepID=A0A8J3BIR8_9ACTN|nr:ATP-binding protein [Pilimelia terevasa]GGK17320.1 hypothetical protein GCM10010124_07310 [Pilimelia terevasa]
MASTGSASTQPVPAPLPGESLLDQQFADTDVTSVRHLIVNAAREAGLVGQPLDDFVLAVNELVTNAVRHGGGAGRLRLWRAAEGLCCEVADTGAGLSRDHPVGRSRPRTDVAGGWGMWLARRLSTAMSVTTGAAGTTVRIMIQLSEA